MGERKKISLTELDESSIVASFKEEQPALAVPLAVEPETPVPHRTESLFSYVDNVLEKHFADWQGDIEHEYKQRNTGIF